MAAAYLFTGAQCYELAEQRRHQGELCDSIDRDWPARKKACAEFHRLSIAQEWRCPVPERSPYWNPNPRG